MMMSHILKCGNFTKNTKTLISREQNIFSSNNKNYSLHIKCYVMAKNSFVVEVTFNKHAPLKKKTVRGNNAPFMNKEF